MLTSGLLLTEIPESELKVSWRFQTFLLTKLLLLLRGDGETDFLDASTEVNLDGCSSTSLLLAVEVAWDRAREGGFEFPLILVPSLWSSPADDDARDDARDDALDGGFEFVFNTVFSSILSIRSSIGSIESLRRTLDDFTGTRSRGRPSLVLLRYFRRRLLRKSTDLS